MSSPHPALQNPVFLQRIFSLMKCDSKTRPAIFNSVCQSWSEAISKYFAAAFFWKGMFCEDHQDNATQQQNKLSPKADHDIHKILMWCCKRPVRDNQQHQNQHENNWIFQNILEAARMVEDVELRKAFLDCTYGGVASRDAPNALRDGIRYGCDISVIKRLLHECSVLGTEFFAQEQFLRGKLLNVCCGALYSTKDPDFVTALVDLVIEKIQELLADEYYQNNETDRVSFIQKILENNADDNGQTPLVSLLHKTLKSFQKIDPLKKLVDFIRHNLGDDYIKVRHLVDRRAERSLVPYTKVFFPLEIVCRTSDSLEQVKYFVNLLDEIGGKKYLTEQLESQDKKSSAAAPFVSFCEYCEGIIFPRNGDAILRFLLEKFEEIGGLAFVESQLSNGDFFRRKSAFLHALKNRRFTIDGLQFLIAEVMRIGGFDLFVKLTTINKNTSYVKKASDGDPPPIGFYAVEAVFTRDSVNVNLMYIICDLLQKHDALKAAFLHFEKKHRQTLLHQWRLKERYQELLADD